MNYPFRLQFTPLWAANEWAAVPAFPVGKGCIHLYKKCSRRETAFIFSPCDFLVVPANTLQAEICEGAIHNEWQPWASHKSSVIWVFFFGFFLRASRISKMERLLKLRKFSYNRIQNWKWCRVLVYLYCIFGRQLYWLNENRTICYPTKKTKFCLSHRIISDELSWSPLESSVLTIQLLYDRFQCGIFHTIFGSCVWGPKAGHIFFFFVFSRLNKKEKRKKKKPIPPSTQSMWKRDSFPLSYCILPAALIIWWKPDRLVVNRSINWSNCTTNLPIHGSKFGQSLLNWPNFNPCMAGKALFTEADGKW